MAEAAIATNRHGPQIDVPSREEDRGRELGPCFRGIDAIELGSCNNHGRGAQKRRPPRSTSSDIDRSPSKFNLSQLAARTTSFSRSSEWSCSLVPHSFG